MPYLKKIFAFLLLMVYLFSATAGRELLKLPRLAEHYTWHSEIGFFGFLALHYGGETGTDSDADEDSRLPFKSASCTALLSIPSIAPPLGFHLLKSSGYAVVGYQLPRNDSFHSILYLGNIWQPPRGA